MFQQQLGTLADKCERIGALAGVIANHIGGDEQLARRAGALCKADLNSEMVYEFDTMQGVMGYYLARNEGLPEELAEALHEQYLPRFAGDTLPATKTGQAVSLADKIDTLVGIFGIGQTPPAPRTPTRCAGPPWAFCASLSRTVWPWTCATCWNRPPPCWKGASTPPGWTKPSIS